MHFMYSQPYLSIKQVHILFQKNLKNMPFFSLFKQEQEISGRGLTTAASPYVHDVCNPDSLYTVFYSIYHFYPVYLCSKCYQTSPIYTFLSFFPSKSLDLNNFWPNSTYPTGQYLVSMDRPLCRPHVTVVNINQISHELVSTK